ncbi:GNAT family N-acetyltransferase [Vibrio sp. B4-12]|nr:MULTISPECIES: GNAT family N-acetyltransferase [Vibrio]MDQ2194805.1 GNAT family N-acetyltransferase [Vibrio sp. A14(2019)]MDQ2196741.1 GNAT family N-acetyltransferase [Vibrio sp. 2017_1457_11]ASG02314.1 GNAT family N-acetyltransferase [Vibrio anguillarum]NNN75416.1 GNAT family N-acetyltransferase [Vibrio sp. B7]NNN92009.1 GNAT family N-acetyltransferase [Vibrio sp. B8-1]
MDISDYDSVIDLWCQTESLSLRDADFKQSIESYLNRNSGLSFVALSGNKIIGAVLVGTDGRRGYLQHLAVSSEFRGQKIGKALVEKSVDALTSIGVSKTHLFVYSNNVNAQNFYEKLGWLPRDEIRMYSFNNSSNPNV